MDVVSKTSGFSRKNLEDFLTVDEILTDVDLLSQDNFLQTQSTDVMERYLRKRSPNLMLAVIEKPEHGPARESIMTAGSLSLSVSQETASMASRGSSPALTSRSVLHSSLGAPRINISYRIEMIERELEDGKMTMDKLMRRFDSAKFLLQVEEENLKIELDVLIESGKLLGTFIGETADKRTGRLFHDKYLRFLENELNSKDRELRKMKLKTKTFQTEYSRLKSQQQQKLELRERLHPVDLEKLHIENQELLELLEEKTKQLLDLKKTVGRKGQSLVLMKSKLNDTVLSIKNVAQDIKQKETKYEFTQTKETQNKNDLVSAEILNKSIKKLNNTFKSPDVHSYLMVEVRLGELRKEKEAWERRCRYQRQNLKYLEHQVKQLAPPETRKSMRYSRSSRSMKSFATASSRSADSILKQCRDSVFITNCTPHPNNTPSQ